MKAFLFLLVLSGTYSFSQQLLTPQNLTINSKLIKDETSESVWYAENAGTKTEIGSIITEIKKLNKTDLLIKTIVKIKKTPDASWTDSTIVKSANFLPSYHSSYNSMRDMVLKSGKNKVTGYYLDKKSQKKDLFETDAFNYFDSSSYPMMIRFLPLKENYSSEISIFDYNPKANKNGVMKAYVLDVKKVDYKGKQVWAVKTTDDISNKTTITTYYIDPDTRKTVSQDIEMNGRKMYMEAI